MIQFIYFLSRMKQTTIVFDESRVFVGWLQEQIQSYPLISATPQLYSKIAWLNIYVQITFTVDSFQFRFRYIQVNCSSAKYDFGTKRRIFSELHLIFQWLIFQIKEFLLFFSWNLFFHLHWNINKKTLLNSLELTPLSFVFGATIANILMTNFMTAGYYAFKTPLQFSLWLFMLI